MTKAKVCDSDELTKLKEVKKLTAKKCCVEGCDNIGRWDLTGKNFYLSKGMCNAHFKKFKKYGDPNYVFKSDVVKRKLAISNIESNNIKAEKRLTACKCKIIGCNNIGKWNDRKLSYVLQKDMCNAHYLRYLKYGDANKVFRIRDGHGKHRLYSTWATMTARIKNPKNKEYPRYGGRGLGIEPRWIDSTYGFLNFLEDMGECPKGCSLDRIENEIGYFKNNCRWATIHQQQANRRDNNENVGVTKYLTTAKNERWIAKLMINGKSLSKSFKTEIDAIVQRKAWEIEYKIY